MQNIILRFDLTRGPYVHVLNAGFIAEEVARLVRIRNVGSEIGCYAIFVPPVFAGLAHGFKKAPNAIFEGNCDLSCYVVTLSAIRC